MLNPYLFFENKNLAKWLQGDNVYKTNKEESNFGKQILLDFFRVTPKSWSGILGEKITEFLLEFLGNSIKKPKPVKHMKPDLETSNCIIEIKSRCYTITGTAGEKILGTPYKYADLPIIFNKPLKIILVGYQEVEAINKFGLFGNNNKNQSKMIDFWKTLNIQFEKCSDLYKSAEIKFKTLHALFICLKTKYKYNYRLLFKLIGARMNFKN